MRSCAALLDISNPLKDLLEFGLVGFSLVWLVLFCLVEYSLVWKISFHWVWLRMVWFGLAAQFLFGFIKCRCIWLTSGFFGCIWCGLAWFGLVWLFNFDLVWGLPSPSGSPWSPTAPHSFHNPA